MKISCSLILLLLLFLSGLRAQSPGVISGLLTDSAANPITDATITLFTLKDSTLVSFTRSLASGHFMIKGIQKGNYRLLITHVGYSNFNKAVSLNGIAGELALGRISLSPHAELLGEVSVEQEKAPVTIKQDTIEFNAGSFKTKPNAVAEDLLKKLPGIQVDKNGTIKANGEEVKKVLVDGKEFFGKDPKIASKNLPADAVDKVQVFDKKSDQASFTGIDDGNREKTINLTIKPDKKNGVFGLATAAAGNDDRYEGRLNLNQFKGDQQLSLLATANNVNKQGFSFQEVMNFAGGIAAEGGRGNSGPDPFNSGIPIQGFNDNNQAITETLSGGLNFNNSWKKTTDLTSSYFYNRTDDQLDQQTSTRYLLPGNAYTQNQHNLATRMNENNRLALGTDIRLDSFNSFKFNSSLVFQKTDLISQKNYFSQASDSSLLNDGYSLSHNGGNAYNWSSTGLFRHRFRKKGRTLSAFLNLDLTNGQGNGSMYSINQYYQPKLTDTINQVNDLSNWNASYGVNLVYTEPLSKKSLLEFTYNLNQIRSQLDKHTFDADFSGKYIIPNAALTNQFDNTYTYNRQGIQFRNQQKKFSFTFGLTAEMAALKNKFGYLSGDSSLNQHFFNLLPHGNLQVQFNKYRRLELFYNSFTRQPAVNQLQPVADNSDPLNIKVGNPDLLQEYYHQLRFAYMSFDPFRRTNFFAMLNYTGTHNKIVNADLVAADGIRISKPVNLNGLFNINSNISWGFPLRAIKSMLSIDSRIAYDHNASLVNGQRNNSANWTLSQGLTLNYFYKEKLDLSAIVKSDYYDSRYSLEPGENSNYWMQTYGFEMNLYFPKGFSFASDLNYTHRNGLSGEYNVSPLIWNAGIAKQVFKNKKGQFRLQVFDILQQSIGISRNTNQNYVQDISNRILSRYFLFGFTYNISRFAGRSVNGGPGVKDDIKIINN